MQKKIKLRRRDQSTWRSVAHLFPEFAVSRDATALRARFGASTVSSFRNELNHKAAVFVPGLLLGPRFTPQSVWVNGTVKGWVEDDLLGANRASDAEQTQAAALMKQMSAARVGGSFWAQDIAEGQPKVFLRASGITETARLLDEALQAYQATDILLLVEQYSASIEYKCQRLGVEVVAGLVDPWSVLARCRTLWVGGDDELAALGVLTGQQVLCHSPGLAAGWGLTGDSPTIARRASRDMTDFAVALLMRGARYGDPRTGQAIDAESAIALLADWRAITQANRAIGCCVGISFWKRRRMAAFFHNGQTPPRFAKTARQAVDLSGKKRIAVWNSRVPPGLPEKAGPRLLRLEDGFIRSLGLGSGFLPPSSIVVDSRGIYYDPQRPSDLEHILSETVFNDTLRERAAALVTRLNQRGITKYAAGGAAETIAAPAGRRRILVPGQVADDLSVALGGGAVRSNLRLLESVRAHNPNAWLIYKPHPDVEAGHRPGAIAVADLQRCADQVVRGGAMSALITQVDEVHTMTSLAGFEALLRGRVVTVYGQPFYAGWGLTTDLAPVSRRTRGLLLDELAAGVLILYPRYLDPVSQLPCSPELLLDRLEQPELWRPSTLMRLRALQGKLKRRLQNV